MYYFTPYLFVLEVISGPAAFISLTGRLKAIYVYTCVLLLMFLVSEEDRRRGGGVSKWVFQW